MIPSSGGDEGVNALVLTSFTKRMELGRGSDRADVRGGFRIRERLCEKNGFRCSATQAN